MDLSSADWSSRKFARLARGAGLAIVAAGALLGGKAQAAEGGASLYLLGSAGPEAAVMPPLEGVYFDTTGYYYDGSAGGGKQFVVGGAIVANLRARIAADFATLVWVPSTSFGGGTLELGGTLPMGAPTVDASAILTGPLGRRFSVSRSDSAGVVGDPVFTVAWGRKFGNFYVEGAGLLNAPIGEYRPDELANLAFHRWAGDTSLAVTWSEPKSGWDISGKAGFTFNGTNDSTQYTTGTEFHVEGAIQKALSKRWSLSGEVYYYDQVTGDSGPGAKLGPFEGQVVGLGGSAAYSFTVGHTPMSLRGRIMTEFDAVNRLEGTSYWLDLSFPLAMKVPTPSGPVWTN